MSNHAHLIYLTGLSMDKKRLNYIAENINRDIDFTYWFTQVKEEIDSLLKDGSRENLIEKLDGNINIIKVMIEQVLKNKFPDDYDNIKNYVHPILTDILDLKRDEGNYSFRDDIDYDLNDFFDDMKSKIKNYHNGDFFSLYISHQSDSIGVAPISKISASESLTLLNSYCDLPYYDNKYINHIILKIKKTAVKKEHHANFESFVKSNFYIHFLDTFLSNLVGESKSNNLSYFDMIKMTKGRRTLKDIQDSLSERNFYGIALLSQLFYNLQNLLKNKELNISIDKNNAYQREFLKEIINSSASPDNINFSDNADIKAKIYFSDGLKLDVHNSSKLDENIFKIDDEQAIGNDLSLDTASDNRVDASYFETKDEDEYFRIKIPIKITLSLPVNKKGEVDSSLFIPYGLNPENKDVVDIVTVGGAEHNRALSHLINKHRKEYKEKRIFGFMDNRYDLENKVKYLNDGEYEHSFLMGLNQPVAGYNAIFSARVDNNEGESVSWNAKLLGYRLKEEDRTYNILSIYGFSALASVFGMHYIVTEIDEKIKQGEIGKEGVFSDFYLSALESNNEINPHQDNNSLLINKGLSALILYPTSANDQLKQQFDNKVPLYIFNTDFDLYKKTFSLNRKNKEAIYSKLKYGKNTIDLMIK